MKYKDAVLELRLRMNLSQEKLAHLIGASFVSVNRWENGKHKPTKIVKAKLNKLFVQHGIEVEN